MAAPLRFGILGCGRIARRGMIPAFLSVTDATLHAIASARPGIAAEWAAEFDIPAAFDSYETLLQDRSIDAVYIPASGELHHPLTLAAARAGKHVLCEKPLAMTLAQTGEMADVCRKQGVLLQEAFMWRHHPRAATVRELLAQGAIGPLRIINVSFGFVLPETDWRMRPERGGGAMWDLGCYGVDAARLFTGAEPNDIYARAHFGATGVDLSMQIALRFHGSVLANISCSFETAWHCRMDLVGGSGRIELPKAFQHFSPVLRLWRTTDRDEEPETIAFDETNQYACQLAAFCESIRTGRLLAPAEDGLANMRVLETALRQAREADGAAVP
jgi:predicted dehydrogenase